MDSKSWTTPHTWTIFSGSPIFESWCESLAVDSKLPLSKNASACDRFWSRSPIELDTAATWVAILATDDEVEEEVNGGSTNWDASWSSDSWWWPGGAADDVDILLRREAWTWDKSEFDESWILLTTCGDVVWDDNRLGGVGDSSERFDMFFGLLTLNRACLKGGKRGKFELLCFDKAWLGFDRHSWRLQSKLSFDNEDFWSIINTSPMIILKGFWFHHFVLDPRSGQVRRRKFRGSVASSDDAAQHGDFFQLIFSGIFSAEFFGAFSSLTFWIWCNF